MGIRTIEACCQPVTEEALSAEQAEELAAAFKVLADPVRLRLLSLVATAADGEVCACDLPEPVGRSQPTVSHHLSVLVEAGLLEREQRGRWAWFWAVPERLAVLSDALAVRAATNDTPPMAPRSTVTTRAVTRDGNSYPRGSVVRR